MRIPFIPPPRTPVRGTWPWVIALIGTALLFYMNGWNSALDEGRVEGMRAACPHAVAHSLGFEMRDMFARAELPPDSPLRVDLTEYDQMRASAVVCGLFIVSRKQPSFWKHFFTTLYAPR